MRGLAEIVQMHCVHWLPSLPDPAMSAGHHPVLPSGLLLVDCLVLAFAAAHPPMLPFGQLLGTVLLLAGCLLIVLVSVVAFVIVGCLVLVSSDGHLPVVSYGLVFLGSLAFAAGHPIVLPFGLLLVECLVLALAAGLEVLPSGLVLVGYLAVVPSGLVECLVLALAAGLEMPPFGLLVVGMLHEVLEVRAVLVLMCFVPVLLLCS